MNAVWMCFTQGYTLWFNFYLSNGIKSQKGPSIEVTTAMPLYTFKERVAEFLWSKIFTGTCREGRYNEGCMEGWFMEREYTGINVK